ncbi:hypothetical protein ABT024_03890 [Streptomyces sp. NPDC002812]|uniref:hypothetical protein n=1 Tax=Streptomyces sp. NPDC002812 TaxID=3154434 RepID=UPI0033334DBD
MTPHNELRLLPWSGPDGKPCFLSADDTAGYLSRLADSAEAAQLGLGSELLIGALEVLTDKEVDKDELRLLATDLTAALRDVVRVAISRGHRLSTPTFSTTEERSAAPRSQVVSG